MNPVKIVFFGSSLYSLIILKELLKLNKFQLVTIVTKPDKPTGRDQEIIPNPVADFAKSLKLPLLQPADFSPNFKLEIRNLKLDIGLCVAFGPPFFDQEMIDLFPYKIINIHPSPLPKYRGATPGPWQIINGETNSAITYFQIDLLPDHGPIISQIPFLISPTETSASFYEKAFNLAATKLSSILDTYITNPQSVVPQDHSQKTYFPKFEKSTTFINWSWSPQKIDAFVRAMLPWPIAWTTIMDKNGQIKTMKVFSVIIQNDNAIPNNVQISGKKLTTWSQINKYYQIIKT